VRRVVLFACVLAALVFAAEFFLKPLVVAVAQPRIQAALKTRAVSVQGLEFKFRPWTFLRGRLSITQLQYSKLKLENIRSRVRLAGTRVLFEDLSGQMLNGTVKGNASVKLAKEPSYAAALEFSGLDLAEVIRTFELKEKLQMTGRLGGKLSIKGKGSKMDVLVGNLSTEHTGGTMIITDTKFLENMARGSGQQLDIIVESFKNYHYTNGNVSVSLQGGDLVLDTGLEGETGKRDLSVTLHDFSKPK